MFQETLILAAAYVLFIAFLYSPKAKPATESVQYFPEVETDISEPTEPAIATKSIPVIPSPWELETTVEPVTVTAIATVEPAKILYLLPPAKDAVKPVTSDLNSLSIRELKKRASQAKIKRYSLLNKSQLIEALAA